MRWLLVIALVVMAAALGWFWPRPQQFPSIPNRQSLPAGPISMIQKTSIGPHKQSTAGDCAYLCGADGHCDSPEFFECLNMQTDRYGVDGRQRTSLNTHGRRVNYDQLVDRW